MFRIYLPITKTRKGSDGKLLVSGIASGPLIDKDNERFDEKAVAKMADQLNKSPKPLRAEHQDKFYTNVGMWKSASLDENFQMMVEGEVNTELSLGRDIEYLLNKGEKIGLSVGGRVVQAVSEYVKELGKTVKVYKDVILDEISIVMNPAYTAAEVGLAKSVNWASVQKSNGQAVLDSTEAQRVLNYYKSLKEVSVAEFEKQVIYAKNNAKKNVDEMTNDVSSLIKSNDMNGVISYFSAVQEMNDFDKRRMVDRTMLTMKTLVDNRFKLQPKLFSDYFNNLYSAMKNALTKTDDELVKEFTDKTGIQLASEDLQKYKHAYEYMQGLRKDYPNGFDYSQAERAARSFEKIVLAKSTVIVEGTGVSGDEKLTKAFEEFVQPAFQKGLDSASLQYSHYFYNVDEAIQILGAVKEKYAEIKDKLKQERQQEEIDYLSNAMADLAARREAIQATMKQGTGGTTEQTEDMGAEMEASKSSVPAEANLKTPEAAQRHDVPQDDAKGSNSGKKDVKKNDPNDTGIDEEETTASKGEKPKQRHDVPQDEDEGGNKGKKEPMKKEQDVTEDEEAKKKKMKKEADAEDDDEEDDDGEHPTNCKCTKCKKARKAAKESTATQTTQKEVSPNQTENMDTTTKSVGLPVQLSNEQATVEAPAATPSPVETAPAVETKTDEQTLPTVTEAPAAVEPPAPAVITTPEAPVVTEQPSSEETIEKSVKLSEFQKFQQEFGKFSKAMEVLSSVLDNVEKRLEKTESVTEKVAQLETVVLKSAQTLETVAKMSMGRRSLASAFMPVSRESVDTVVEKTASTPTSPLAQAMDKGESFQDAYKQSHSY